VVTEVVYLLGTRLGAHAELRFVADLASGACDVEPVHPMGAKDILIHQQIPEGR
jgi:hypothetical protein